MTQPEAQQTAVLLFGPNAIAWTDPLGRLFFVKADKDPRKVTDLTMPFGVGLSWEDAFRNVRPQYAEKGIKGMHLYKFKMAVSNEEGKLIMFVTVQANDIASARKAAKRQYPEWSIESGQQIGWQSQ